MFDLLKMTFLVILVFVDTEESMEERAFDHEPSPAPHSPDTITRPLLLEENVAAGRLVFSCKKGRA
jgi:hypothetical protein